LHSTFNKYTKDLTSAHINIQRRQDQMSGDYNRARRSVSYAVGDLVLLSRAGITLKVDSASPTILLQRWLGPYRVLAFDPDLSNVTLELPPSMRCHNIFHVSHTKLWKLPDTSVREPINLPAPEPDAEGMEAFEVDKVVDFGLDSSSGAPLFRIRWRGYSRAHDTWEPLSNLGHAHTAISDFLRANPDVDFTLPSLLEDQAESRGGVVK
jgi:hypothetical protein